MGLMQPAAVEGASKQQPLQVGKQASTKECDTAPLLKGPATDSELRPPTVSLEIHFNPATDSYLPRNADQCRWQATDSAGCPIKRPNPLLPGNSQGDRL